MCDQLKWTYSTKLAPMAATVCVITVGRRGKLRDEPQNCALDRTKELRVFRPIARTTSEIRNDP